MKKDILGKDIELLFYRNGMDLKVKHGDLALVESTDNLAQALTLRLNSYQGILRKLGHLKYGGRLLEAIGTPNNKANMRTVESLVRESILQEPRVRSISSLSIRADASNPGTLNVEASVIPIDEQVPLNLVITLSPGVGE